MKRAVCAHCGLVVTACTTWLTKSSPLWMSPGGCSSVPAPWLASEFRFGSTNDTCGSVPAAASIWNCLNGALGVWPQRDAPDGPYTVPAPGAPSV